MIVEEKKFNKDVKVTNNCKAENKCYKCNNKDLLCENFELKV